PEVDGGVRVSVTDEGIGIPEKELDSIFGLFYRSPDRAARDAAGMGLGLYISREIVVRHGGRIWAESGGAKGSRLNVTIPRGPPVCSTVKVVRARAHKSEMRTPFAFRRRSVSRRTVLRSSLRCSSVSSRRSGVWVLLERPTSTNGVEPSHISGARAATKRRRQ